jgi:hypothetical protein
MSYARTRRRWGDNDLYWGPFTYSKAEGEYAYRPWAIELSSGCDEYPGNSLRFSGFSRTLIIALPAIIKPWRRWVDCSKYEWATSEAKGYWDVHRREYGFSLTGSGRVGGGQFLQVHFGAQTHDSSTTQDWCWFLPWTEWRHVRRSLYDLQGAHYWTEPKGLRYDHDAYLTRKAAEDGCPSVTFAFTDYDGEALTARTRIEEREWRFGDGWFKWLSVFRAPIIQRTIDIAFSGETGKRKGSWKGGTMGTGFGMEPGELHESAFRRYCAKHNMVFGGEAAWTGRE